VPQFSGDRGGPARKAADATAPAAPGSGGGVPPELLVAALVLAAAAVAALGVVLRRERRLLAGVDPDLLELARALLRSGRRPQPATTLRRLERTLGGGSPAARAYLRAVASARYAGRGSGPTSEQRRALRRELAAGLGVRGRLRALWALPPWRPRARRASHGRSGVSAARPAGGLTPS
jgi:hypothetical protein